MTTPKFNRNLFGDLAEEKKQGKIADRFLEEEHWKEVIGYEDFYKISSYGRVKSLDRIIYKDAGDKLTQSKLTNNQIKIIKQRIKNGDVQRTIAKDFGVCPQTITFIKQGKTWKSNKSKFVHKGKLLKPKLDRYGYLSVGLTKDGKQKWYNIHRLVAIAFIPNPENKKEVNHKNTYKLDNFYRNLEWLTKKEHDKHTLENGLYLKEENHPMAKLSINEVKEIRSRLANGETCYSICKDFCVSSGAIAGIKYGRKWKDVK